MTQRIRVGRAFAAARKASAAAAAFFVCVAMGCSTTTFSGAAERYEVERAREMGPADYAYADALESALRADVVTGIRTGLEDDIANTRAIIGRLAEKSAAIRRDTRLSAVQRRVQDATYAAQIRTLQDRLLRQQDIASGLRTHEGILMQRCQAEQVRGAALEEGRLPSAIY